jgi:hypothetical protein
MFLNGILEDAIEQDLDTNDVDALLPADPETDEGIDRIADQVEDAMQRQALEAADYFDGGAEAVQTYMESAEVQAFMEAFPFGGGMKKRTFVNLSRKDDFRRRMSVAALTIAKEKKDPLFDKWVRHRIKERSYRSLIFKKYKALSYKAAKRSQKKHLAEKKRFPALPFFGKKDAE